MNKVAVFAGLLFWSWMWDVWGLLLAVPIPVVKHLWTPSYAVLAHGVACAVLFAVHWLVHRRGQRWWIRPFTDLGANPIVVYIVMSAAAVLLFAHARDAVVGVLAVFGAATASVTYALAVAALGWALAAGMRRRGIFVRV